jgi:long-chain acyl-CoA synthetase
VTLPQVRALFESEINAVNADLAPFETIRRFALLEDEMTQENGALTATLKVKRRVVTRRYGAIIDSLYAGHGMAQSA